MDIQSVDPKTLDVAYRVKNLAFRFFDDTESARLSVCRLIYPHAFDELGRPIAHGLYDPALGPTCIDDGPCVTCGQSYASCPGHFGHIELPFSVPNPLLFTLIFRLVRASCAFCYRLRISKVDRELLLARLYFEDSGHPQCSAAVEAYRLSQRNAAAKAVIVNKEGSTAFSVATNWTTFFERFPLPLVRYLDNIDVGDSDLIRRNILHAANHEWKRAYEKGQLMNVRSQGWREVESILLTSSSSDCQECSHKPAKLRVGDKHGVFRTSHKSLGETLVSAIELERQVAGLWNHHPELFDLLYGLKGRRKRDSNVMHLHRHLFVRNVLVPPSRFRPSTKTSKMSYAAEHPQNMFFQRLLTEIKIIITGDEIGFEHDGEGKVEVTKDGVTNPDGTSDTEDLKPRVNRPSKARYARAMFGIQEALHDLYDSSKSSAYEVRIQNTGIRQQLEQKAGLFRQHMMGKRVNYSCRSVIGPDVFLDTDEVGIPESFAKLLTVPETVTPQNWERMRSAVLNGADHYPGALSVESVSSSGDVRVVKLQGLSKRQLVMQAGLLLQNPASKMNGEKNLHLGKMDTNDLDENSTPASVLPKRVHRHLRNGDIVLFNRQPTLHRVSIMAHRVKVLPGDRTIRFHYANCGSYNADFDGDEMNVHIPQDYIARSEAEELMLSSKHYIVPTSGAPIRGLIQDHIAAAALLSRRDTFLDRETFIQLLYTATEKIMLRSDRLQQSYFIPVPSIMKPVPLWTGKQLISAVLSIIRNGAPGLQLEGRAKTPANIISFEETDIVFRKGELLKGVIDKSSLGSSMYGIVHAIQEVYGNSASNDFLSSMSRLCLYFMRAHGHTTGVIDLELSEEGDKRRAAIVSECIQTVGVDVVNRVYADMNSSSSTKIKKAGNAKQARRLIEKMVRSHGVEAEDRLGTAMMSIMNQVASSVMSECIPNHLLKPFPENGFALMTNTGAKGSAVNAAQISCLLGSTVLEGKRVPRMGGSGSTLPCFEPFDSSPLAGGFISSRFLTGISPQEFFFHAMSGREGLLDTSLKTANSGYLQRCLMKHLEALRVHYDGTVRDSDESVLQFIYGDDGIDPCKSRWLTSKVDWQVKNKNCLKIYPQKLDFGVSKIRNHIAQLKSNGKPFSGTMLELTSPAATSRRGAISEYFDSIIEDALAKEDGVLGVRSFLEARYQAATAEAGDAVGVIAAQGVGEPSTQMTLNTFHHAGSSSAHVTLGIPRLRELLMNASLYPKTPTMILPLRKGLEKADAENLRNRLQKITLLDLILKMEIHEKELSFNPNVSSSAMRTVVVVFYFPEEHLYLRHTGLNFLMLEAFVRSQYVDYLNVLLRTEIKKLESQNFTSFKHYLLTTSNKLGTYEPNISGEEDMEVNQSFEGEEDEERIPDSADESSDESSSNESSSDESASNERRGENKSESNVVSKSAELDDELEVDSLQKAPVRVGKEFTMRKRRRKDSNLDRSNKVGHDDGTGQQFGFRPWSVKSRDSTRIEFDWVLPIEAIGVLNLATIVREAAMYPLVQVKKISRCFVNEDGGQHAVITEGSNISDAIESAHELVDFDHLETNDMTGILTMYGVEALRAALIKEILKVFNSYGIPVNVRHLQLIADYLTFHGKYRGFNRGEMSEVPSPIQKMTFESSVKFLTLDALNGTTEYLNNPSATLALSQLPKIGSGSFQLMHCKQ